MGAAGKNDQPLSPDIEHNGRIVFKGVQLFFSAIFVKKIGRPFFKIGAARNFSQKQRRAVLGKTGIFRFCLKLSALSVDNSSFRPCGCPRADGTSSKR